MHDDAIAAPDHAGRSPDGVVEPTAPSRPADTVTAPPPAPRRSGFGSILTAGVLGGLIGAGGSYLAEHYWLSPTQTVEPRLRAVEQRIGPLPAGDPTAGLQQRLAAVEAGQRAGAERLLAAQALAEANRQRLDEALNRPALPASDARQGGTADPALVDALKTRLTAIEEQLRTQDAAQAGGQAGGQAPADGQDLQRLESRLAEQDQRVAPLAAQLSEQGQRFAAVSAQITEQGQRFGAISAEIAEQGQRVNAVAAQASDQAQKLGALTLQMAEQNQRLAALAKQVGDRGPETAALRVVAADQIATSLRSGAPYAEALTALRRLNTPAEQLAALEPFASSGAPTGPTLAQEFAPLRERIVAQSRPPANDWTDRLARMAEGVVTVRPLGKSESSSVSGAVGRIDEALGRSAFKEAVTAFDALPEPARQISADWGRKLKARAAAEDATRILSSQALTAVNAPTR